MAQLILGIAYVFHHIYDFYRIFLWNKHLPTIAIDHFDGLRNFILVQFQELAVLLFSFAIFFLVFTFGAKLQIITGYLLSRVYRFS